MSYENVVQKIDEAVIGDVVAGQIQASDLPVFSQEQQQSRYVDVLKISAAIISRDTQLIIEE